MKSRWLTVSFLPVLLSKFNLIPSGIFIMPKNVKKPITVLDSNKPSVNIAFRWWFQGSWARISYIIFSIFIFGTLCSWLMENLICCRVSLVEKEREKQKLKCQTGTNYPYNIVSVIPCIFEARFGLTLLMYAWISGKVAKKGCVWLLILHPCYKLIPCQEIF